MVKVGGAFTCKADGAACLAESGVGNAESDKAIAFATPVAGFARNR